MLLFILFNIPVIAQESQLLNIRTNKAIDKNIDIKTSNNLDTKTELNIPTYKQIGNKGFLLVSPTGYTCPTYNPTISLCDCPETESPGTCDHFCYTHRYITCIFPHILCILNYILRSYLTIGIDCKEYIDYYG